MFKRLLLSLAVTLICCGAAHALGGPQYVEEKSSRGAFALANGEQLAPIWVDETDHAGVLRAAGDLRADIQRVTGKSPVLSSFSGAPNPSGHVVLVGSLGKSRLIDRLAREKKIDVSAIAGKWEASIIQTVSNPLPGVQSALVIAGSDKRGTIFGIYDVSEKIGVSPWYWWADVPVKTKSNLFIKAGRYLQGEPAVKYRGIFLNDEEPALGSWAREKFGGFNSKFYVAVYELMLRLKSNYLWPAMWGKSLYEADPLSAKLADEYGIVVGTSHHEPMMRAHVDWKKDKDGAWNYITNGDRLRQFWRDGVRRNKNYETMTTIGMRGDGDEPMMEDADAATKLMESIVADQRRIITEEVNPNVEKVPQMWALYKEVQSYYEKGMRVPDDVTLLWCDDNWGNIRRLPTPEERNRSGGAGVYYHFDYVGGPRSYKWLNTIDLTKIWQQMNLAHEYGANRIWIVNVGDLKPMELPIEFFLDFAREPKAWTKEMLPNYTRQWAAREFGAAHAADIADILDKYTKYNARRKPELLSPDTYSLTNYNEAERVLHDWNDLAAKAEMIGNKLPKAAWDAYFQLVLYPTKASANLNTLYYATAKNRLYAAQGRPSANQWAARARELFKRDAELSAQYHQLNGGKWNHMMRQPRIGYTSWNDPPNNIMPELKEVSAKPNPILGVAVEGSTTAYTAGSEATLPRFDVFNRQSRWIELFNQGSGTPDYLIESSAPWIYVDRPKGAIQTDERMSVRIDWDTIPEGTNKGTLRISTTQGEAVVVNVEAFRPASLPISFRGFVESDGYVSIEAPNFTRKVDAKGAKLEKIADYGNTLGGVTMLPANAPAPKSIIDTSHLEYQMYVWKSGEVSVESVLAPTLDFLPNRPLRLAVALNDEAPKILEIPRQTHYKWGDAVRDNAWKIKSTHTVAAAGANTLKVWLLAPGMVLEKLVVNTGGVKPSYLGPPQSYLAEVNSR